MPTLNESNVRHLLRRTEVVDRPDRVAELLSLGSISAAVDNIMQIDGTPPTLTFSASDDNWWRGVRLAEFWLERMAMRGHSSPRPFGERMALFWHGHICTEIVKTHTAEAMRDQLDLFRSHGLGTASQPANIPQLLKLAAVQPAMLRYLDNNRNFAESPNQNFARELMELFVLGVGNYTEADVEAATAAWTGHTDDRDADLHYFDPARHHQGPLQFLGQVVNGSEADPTGEHAGNEIIDVMFGGGVIPGGAAMNAGRSSAEVAADFLSWKLWQEFGEADSGGVPAGVKSALRDALLTGGQAFDIRRWVRTLLTHNDFYADSAKEGLVRQPAEYMVALMVATGVPAASVPSNALLERAGQRLLDPPNVSGWRPNGFWVNASAMEARGRMVQGFLWIVQAGTWTDVENGFMTLPGGVVTRSHMKNDSAADFVGRLLAGLQLRLAPESVASIVAHLEQPSIRLWMRLDAVMLALVTPEMHLA